MHVIIILTNQTILREEIVIYLHGKYFDNIAFMYVYLPVCLFVFI